jgi:uncharacterized phiE125 gp8 family phage protein
MFYTRKTAPAALLTRDEVKAHLGVTGTADDVQIDALIAVATAHLDGRAGVLNRALCTQDWQVFSGQCAGGFVIQFGPLQAVTEVAAMVGGVYQALASSAWRAQRTLNGVIVTPAPNAAWPAADDHPEAYRIEVKVGYGVPADVPAPIRQAAILMIGDMWGKRCDNASLRMEQVDGVGTRQYSAPDLVSNAILTTVDRLITPYRMTGL